MRAINHSLTGAIIGLTVVDAEIALPLAFASHFILDAIPHHGYKGLDKNIKGLRFITLLIIDAILCTILVFYLIFSKPTNWLIAIICAFVAALPDFFSINLFYKTLKGLPHKPNLYTRFASTIQWFEKPIGVVVELAWLVASLTCLAIFLHK